MTTHIQQGNQICSFLQTRTPCKKERKPEKILIADGDSRKEYTIGVDDLDIDGFGMTGQVHYAVGQKPDEEAACSQYKQQPDDAEQRSSIECCLILLTC